MSGKVNVYGTLKGMTEKQRDICRSRKNGMKTGWSAWDVAICSIQDKLKNVPEKDRNYYVLAAYNYGMQGARTHLWNKGIVKYDYNEEIMNRAEQLKEETRKAREGQ